jgi:hypothetical protein
MPDGVGASRLFVADVSMLQPEGFWIFIFVRPLEPLLLRTLAIPRSLFSRPSPRLITCQAFVIFRALISFAMLVPLKGKLLRRLF